MQFYNTLSKRKQEFVPQEEGKVHMYVCGITAYDYCHIGHARAAVVFDALVRFLRYKGYQVYFVRNFTDVDDKIINRAREEGLDSSEVTSKYIQAFYQDMDQLRVLRADLEPKATEYIQDMQELVQDLLQKGYAYTTPAGDVYFRVRAFTDYGSLSGRNIEELQAGARIEPGEEKQDPLDFALWKHAKPEEPAWDSPWGPGRPGWHIECSAMSQRLLGLPLDIHGGGQDLAFPHHENERAQSMAATGLELARYWLHNGFVQVHSEKMSKSLGNFVTLRDIFQDYLPEVLRFFLLSKHYRSPLDFSWESLQESEKGLKRLYQTKQLLEQALEREKWNPGLLPQELQKELEESSRLWEQSLADDLNTAAALGHIFNICRLGNRLLEDKALALTQGAAQAYQMILENLSAMSGVLGLLDRPSQEFLSALRDVRAARLDIDPDRVEEMLQQRQQARQEKDFALADQIRDELAEIGVQVQDTPAGTTWDCE
ncbi:MAG: cysteine--tRNA ligase [Thermodesulfobacteriota bacterium]